MKVFISMLGLFEFLNPFNYIMDIVNLIPKLVYFITATAMGLLDIAQMAMRKLAGLDVHYSADGGAKTGDIALSFLQGIFGADPNYAALRNAFWSLIILAVILLFVSTIIATIRQEYMPGQEEAREKPSNTKTHVINRAVKSLFMFMIVPVSVFFGLMLSDAVLRAMDSITSGAAASGYMVSSGIETTDEFGDTVITYPTDRLVAEAMGDGQTTSYIYYDFFGIGVPTTSTPFSGIAFKTAGFSANRVRIGDEYKYEDGTASFFKLVKENNVSNFSMFNMATTEEEMALMIDDAFAGNVKLQAPQSLDYDSAANSDIRNSMLFPNLKVERFSKYNVALVWYYYNLWQYNFVVAAAFLIVALKIFVKIIAGLMKRIIEMVALFMISPPIIALMPLDGGKAFTQWKNTFLAKALGVYGAIIGMNILFLLLPYINQIKFLEEKAGFTIGNVAVYENAAKMVNMIISTLFIITGLVMVDGLIAMMSNIISADDVAKEGGELSEKVGSTLQDSLDSTALVAGGVTKALTAPVRLARDGANAIGRKATGNKDFKIGGALGSGAKKMLSKVRMPMSAARKKAVEEAQLQNWSEGGGNEQAYDDYIKSQSSYQDSLNRRFGMRSDKDLSQEDWLATEEGQKAQQAAFYAGEHTRGVQSKDEFLAGKTGDGQKAYNRSLRKALTEESNIMSEFPGMIKGAGKRVQDSAFGRAAGSVGREIFKVAGSASAYVSDIGGIVSEALGRKGKQPFTKTMALSFEGKSKKEQERQKKLDDAYKKQKQKEEYEKSKGSSGKAGISEDQAKDLMKKEADKVKSSMETEFRREMEDYFEIEKKELTEQLKAQAEEISNLKKKK